MRPPLLFIPKFYQPAATHCELHAKDERRSFVSRMTCPAGRKRIAAALPIPTF
jgi:hypothetical protein